MWEYLLQLYKLRYCVISHSKVKYLNIIMYAFVWLFIIVSLAFIAYTVFCCCEVLLKDKLNEVDYQKIVTYAIGIVAVYYIGKTMIDSLDEAKAAKNITQSSTSTAAKAVNQRNVSYCNYGKMLLARYGYRHGALRFCSRWLGIYYYLFL